MKWGIQLFIELELVEGQASQFEAAAREVIACAVHHDVKLRYDFYRDPANPSVIYAIEAHPDAASLQRHFDAALPLLQKAWGYARPVKTLILGDVPDALRSMMESNGATVVPAWIGN